MILSSFPTMALRALRTSWRGLSVSAMPATASRIPCRPLSLSTQTLSSGTSKCRLQLPATTPLPSLGRAPRSYASTMYTPEKVIPLPPLRYDKDGVSALSPCGFFLRINTYYEADTNTFAPTPRFASLQETRSLSTKISTIAGL